MTKDQAFAFLEGLAKILHDKGGIQVTPHDYEQLILAIQTLKQVPKLPTVTKKS